MTLKVSIHASAREATATIPRPPARFRRFNPRLRTGGDLCARACTGCPCGFQSTPPHGRRPVNLRAQRRISRSFNPRLRTGGDASRTALCGRITLVSIHASAREATEGDTGAVERGGVSIHASAREATSHSSWLMSFVEFQSTPPHGRRLRPTVPGDPDSLSFNPRLRTGGDMSPRKTIQQLVHVSIHASAREATAVSLFFEPRIGRFNPRLRTGGDISA